MRVRPLIQELHSQDNIGRNTDKEQTTQQYVRPSKGNQIRGKAAKCIVCRKMCHYTCPKCKKNYCGIQHFRSHNLFCSQEFYEKQVTESLKGMKITDKKQKRKAVKMVKNYQQEMEDQYFESDITIERLEQILAQIQKDIEPQLTAKQSYVFNNYLKSLQQKETKNGDTPNSDNITDGTQIEKPYWQVQDGMSLYITQHAEIEEYGQSEYPELIGQRDLFKKRLQQFMQTHSFQQTVIKPVVNLHLVQIVYAFATLFRAFDGECPQFATILARAYTSKQNQVLLKTEQISLKHMIKEISLQMMKVDHNQNGKQEQQNVLQMWINQYSDIVDQDMVTILNNKYLVIQTLFRIIDCVNQVFRVVKPSQQADRQLDLEKINSLEQHNLGKKSDKKLTQKQKQNKLMLNKIVKKCQYLLYLAIHSYKPETCVQIYRAYVQEKQLQNQAKASKNKQILLPYKMVAGINDL